MSPTATTTTLPWVEEASRRFVDIIPDHIDRMDWTASQLRAHQNRALADLVRTAAAWSPFHRRRLHGVDLDRIGVDTLGELPIMTKAEMMADLDDVFTDRRLSRGLIDRHIANLGEEPKLLLDEYVVLATGGSSGTRGVFIIPRDQAADFTAYVLRAGMAQLSAATGWPPPNMFPVGIVMAPTAIHGTRAMTAVMSAVAHITYAPVTLPLAEIIDRLNRAKPLVLVGYPSIMAMLGDAAVAGELSIQPRMVLTTAEQLHPNQIERIAAGFGTPPGNSFGSTEGLVGIASPGREVFTFASDRAIIEFVDADDQPVPRGTRAHHILITNLTSHAQPLIRYRMDDAMTEHPPADGRGHQRATVEGRNDTTLTIGDVAVHPLTFRSALLKHQTIAGYQVRVDNTTPVPRVDIALVTTGPTPLAAVEHDITVAVANAGTTAHITTTEVDHLERNPATGKIQRFISTGTRTAP